MNISTISTADIIPEATKAIHKYTKRSDPHVTLFKYDTHVTVDDLVMDTVEKVLKANPKYLTKTYVWLAAKSTCINRSQKRKLDTIPCAPVFSDDSDSRPRFASRVRLLTWFANSDRSSLHDKRILASSSIWESSMSTESF